MLQFDGEKRRAEMFRNIEGFVAFLIAVIVLCGIMVVTTHDCSKARGEEISSTIAESKAEGKTGWDKHWEAKEKGLYKGSSEGVATGKGWCLGPNSKCSKGIPKRLEKRMNKYGKWFKQFAGGMVPEHLALTSTTEAPEGPGQCSPDSKLKECGLMGVKWTQARDCGCNVCHPGCAIACAAKGANARRMAVYKKYPQIDQAPEFDKYVLGGLAGGIGGLASILLSKSGALATKDDGTLKHKYPYLRLLIWVGSAKQKPQKLVDKIKMGRITTYKMGLRVARPYAALQIVMKHLGVLDTYVKTIGKKDYEKVAKAFEKVKRGKWEKIEIPAEILQSAPYPGDKDHGKCKKKFPGMLKEVP